MGGESNIFYLEKEYVEEIIAQARAEAPNECCGILAGANSRVTRLYRTANADSSPVSYSVHPEELFRIYKETEERGWDILAIYHSHTHTEAYPSARDRELAFWPDSLYLIISLANPDRPVIRAFRIIAGTVAEIPIRTIER